MIEVMFDNTYAHTCTNNIRLNTYTFGYVCTSVKSCDTEEWDARCENIEAAPTYTTPGKPTQC